MSWMISALFLRSFLLILSANNRPFVLNINFDYKLLHTNLKQANRNKEFEVFYNICTKNEDNFCSVLRWLSQLTGYTVSAKKKKTLQKNTPTNLRSSPYVDLQSSITYKHIVRIQWARREFNRFNLDTMCTVQTI